VVDKTLAFLSERLARRGIRVERDFRPGPPIRGDADRLEQLFLNLFLNAIDAMPEGGTLAIALRPRGERQVEIRIRDSGKGIRPEELERIFEPFYTTKPAGQGSGLGLVVARDIVSDHRGRIEVDSEPGQFTEFRIELPVATWPEGR
jgi:signal transduction histidine kinase